MKQFSLSSIFTLGISAPCAFTTCPDGFNCEVDEKGKATCILSNGIACALVDLNCPIPGSSCQVINGSPTCVAPPGAQNPCDYAPCANDPQTICIVLDGRAQCLPNTVG